MELTLSITCLIISEHFDSFAFSTVKLDQTLKISWGETEKVLKCKKVIGAGFQKKEPWPKLMKI